MIQIRLTLFLWLLAMVTDNLQSMTTTNSLARDTHNVRHIDAVLGDKAELPCDVQHNVNNSTEWPILIIWYRGQDYPIYSVDQREHKTNRHWADQSMDKRVYYTENKGFAILIIENVRKSDGGQYRCREDFKYSPTRNNFILLDIIIPPSRLEILDSERKAVFNSTLPPILENESMEITCKAYDGHPLPRVMWNVRGENADEMYGTRIDDQTVANVLRIDRVHRTNLGRKLVCEASNVPNTVQLSTSVIMDVYLKPLSVAITGVEHPFLSGEPSTVDCVSYGSRPAANITWYHGGRIIEYETKRIKVVENHNMTWSTLKLVPTDDDDQSVMRCVASNSYFPADSKEQRITLNVHYPPRLQISLGRNLNVSNIKEGSDVYFECSIKASPDIIRLDWDHNGTAVGKNASRRTIVSNQTLVLQSISRKGSGSYRCIASNDRGKSISDPYHLDVKYEPSCNVDQQHVYGAHKGETAWVKCNVNSNPNPTSYRWAFNNSVSGLINVANSDKSIAIIKLKVTDFGTLLCWATNSLATQIQPCVYHIVPAGRPDPPRNCLPVNVTSTRFTVQCRPGYDGGLPQRLACTVATSERPYLVEASYNGSHDRTAVEVTGLRPSTQYVATVYASNAKGLSPSHVRVYVETAPNPKDPRVAGDSTGTATQFSDGTHVGIILLGCCFVAVCVMAAVYTKRLTVNVRESSVFRGRPTVGAPRNGGEEIRFSGSKDVGGERPVVVKMKVESGDQTRSKTQLKMNEILQNGQYNGIASGSPYSVLAVQDTSNSSQLEGHASDKNNGRLFEPQTQDCNRQKICESFVVYTDNRKSIPIQDMVYTRTPKPYAEIESVV